MNNDCIIGYTGLVGGNLQRQHDFKYKFNSKNIHRICDSEYDLVVCAGVPAIKWWANKFPEEDWENISNLLNHIKEIRCKKFVLISTIDVYDSTVDRNENDSTCTEHHHAYGYNRHRVEQFILNELNHLDPIVIRLPGLFGKGLKKNVIFDLLNDNLQGKLNEHDSYQWYNLDNIFNDIKIAIDNDLKIINLFNEPISMKEIIEDAFENKFKDALYSDYKKARMYNHRTLNFELYEGKDGYICDKKQVMLQLKKYINECQLKGEY